MTQMSSVLDISVIAGTQMIHPRRIIEKYSVFFVALAFFPEQSTFRPITVPWKIYPLCKVKFGLGVEKSKYSHLTYDETWTNSVIFHFSF